jgi:hypothetical protein
LAIFGWFFLPLELGAVVVQWACYLAVESRPARFWKVLWISAGAAAVLLALVGPKEEGHAWLWAAAYGLAAACCAAWSMTVLRVTRWLCNGFSQNRHG